MLLDAIFFEELCQIFAHELRVVIGDDELRDVKSANDVPPYEVLYVYLSRDCHGLCFYPLVK